MTRALGRLTSAAREALADLVAPAACPICEAETRGSPFCPDCRAELLDAGSSPACPRCALLVGPWASLDRGCSECRGRSIGFDAALALAPYQGPLRDLCLRLKHRRDAWLARWPPSCSSTPPSAFDRVRSRPEGPGGVGPAPLASATSDYNQAEALADALARRLGLRSARPLRRVKPTAILAGAGRSERAERLRGAFRARPGRPLDGRTVRLVDDFLTTGATCGSAAEPSRRPARPGRRRQTVAARAEGRA